jgi:hypothetical protein
MVVLSYESFVTEIPTPTYNKKKGSHKRDWTSKVVRDPL